jgi:hypothetical protein
MIDNIRTRDGALKGCLIVEVAFHQLHAPQRAEERGIACWPNKSANVFTLSNERLGHMAAEQTCCSRYDIASDSHYLLPVVKAL